MKQQRIKCPTCKGDGEISNPDGKLLRKERIAAGVSQASIARHLKLSAGTVADYEIGRNGCGFTPAQAADYRRGVESLKTK